MAKNISKRKVSATTHVKATIKKSPLNKKVTKKSLGTCFILMPFKEPFNIYYDTIYKPAVIASNLDPLRGDSLFTPTPIMGDIWSMIQGAKVLLADLTEKNANVFYEMGLGHAIGKPIILVSETMEDVPFDLQPLRVINYNKDDPAWGNKLKSNITAALQDTLSDAFNAVPSMFRKKVKSQAPAEKQTSSRLDSIERKIALIESKNRGLIASKQYLGQSLAEDKEWMRIEWVHVVSPKEAIQFAHRAFIGGIPKGNIISFITEKLDYHEADSIMNEALKI